MMRFNVGEEFRIVKAARDLLGCEGVKLMCIHVYL